MNLCLTIAAATLAFAASVNGNDCSAIQQGKAYWSMKGLLSGSLNECATITGYDMLRATSLPSTEHYAAMCKVTVCHEFVDELNRSEPPDCDLYIPTSGARMNVKILADDFETKCEKLAIPSPTLAPKSYNFRGAD